MVNKKLQLAIIAGAAHAYTYKEQNPNASENEVIQNISDNIDEIVENLEEGA